jgi:imidazolonepropionase-like amidohydrolase
MSWEHATEGHRIADYIAEKKIPAVWGPSLMSRPKWEMRELGYDTPRIMYEAGVKFAIQTDAPASTIIPAEIIGVADRVGSLEVDKDADLRLLSGDPLEFITKCKMVIIDGEIVHSLK